jgi:hypothetical protein
MEEGEMTDSGTEKASESRQRWFADVQAALDRTGDALRTAWDATKESRMSALESAKQAAQELGEVIDQGINAAKERWAESGPVTEAEAPEAPEVPVAPTPEEPVTKEPISIESEPVPESGDVSITPVETDTTEQS